jgi:hypothetical protein
MTPFRPMIAAALLVAFGALGCASVVSDQALMFEVTQHRYTQLMRFTDYEKAGRYVAPDALSEFRDRTHALGDLHFTDYEVREIENLGDTATAEVQYIGYRASNPVIETYIEKQSWELAGGVWLVRSQLDMPTP